MIAVKLTEAIRFAHAGIFPPLAEAGFKIHGISLYIGCILLLLCVQMSRMFFPKSGESKVKGSKTQKLIALIVVWFVGSLLAIFSNIHW